MSTTLQCPFTAVEINWEPSWHNALRHFFQQRKSTLLREFSFCLSLQIYLFQFNSETNARKTSVSFQVYWELLKNSFCFSKYLQPCKLPVSFLWRTLSIETDLQTRCFFTNMHNSTILKLFPNIKPHNSVFSKTTKMRRSSEAVKVSFTEKWWKLYTSFSLRYIGSDIAKICLFLP